MKRALLIVSGFLLLTVAAFWSYSAYQQYRSYQTLIPKNATSVIRIDVDALIKDLAWNALWNPAYYWGEPKGESLRLDRKIGQEMGIAIPANLFLYQTEHPASAADANTYFGTVRLTDTAAFGRWLSDRLHMQVHEDTIGKVAFVDHALVVYDAERAFFALAPQKLRPDARLRNTLQALSASKEWVPISDSRFVGIKRTDGHVIRLSTEGLVAVEFKKGEIGFSWEQEVSSSLASPKTAPDFPESNAVSFWMQGILDEWLMGRQLRLGEHILHGDSLLRHCQSSLVMEWKGTVAQRDTIVSYDYDENFIMHEREEHVEKIVPELYLSVSAGDGFTRYLQAQGIVDSNGQAVNREAIPLYQLATSIIGDGYLQFHTAELPRQLPRQRDAGNDVLYLRIQFGNIDPRTIPSGLARYLQVGDYLELTGRQLRENRVVLQGNLRMRDRRINSLAQLLTMGTAR